MTMRPEVRGPRPIERVSIGFDASCVLAPRSGVGRFTMELLRALAAMADDSFRIVVLLNSLRHDVPAELKGLGDGVRLVRRRLPGPVLISTWARMGMPRMERLLGERVDVVFAPAGYFPGAAAPVVATIHDAAFLRDDPAMDDPLGSGFYRKHWPRLLPRCAAIVTDSAFVQEDIRALCGAVPMRTIPCGVSEVFLNPPKVAKGDYFLAVTSGAARKRNELLLDAWRLYRERGGTAKLRVLGWSGDDSEGVVYLPRMSDEELAREYAGALATVLTTREEGFGFPVLESFACGTPVIAGRHSSLAEIGGEMADWVAEETAAGFAVVMRRVELEPPSDSRRDALRAHARQYTWAASASQYRELFAAVAGLTDPG